MAVACALRQLGQARQPKDPQTDAVSGTISQAKAYAIIHSYIAIVEMIAC